MLRIRIAFSVLLVALAILARPSSAEACSCLGSHPSSAAFNSADLVFVGTVSRLDAPKPVNTFRVNADGSMTASVSIDSSTPSVVTLDVARVFRGGAAKQIVITGEGGCEVPFKLGETWLVYADSRDGKVTTNACTRTRLQTNASQDLVYLEGLEQRRPQGIVYGDVLRRILDGDGKPALQALFEPLQVIAVGAGLRVEITTDKWGPYQLVLPPGDFEIWVERAGRAVAPRQAVRIANGSELRMLLPVEYK